MMEVTSSESVAGDPSVLSWLTMVFTWVEWGMEAMWRRCIGRATKYLDYPLLGSISTACRHSVGSESAPMSAVASKSKSKNASKSAAAAKKKQKAGSKTKKGAKGAQAAAPAGPRGEDAVRLQAIVEACLNAPSPVRYLKEKDRLREIEREKLGLISKDRQREIDMEKAQKKMSAQKKQDDEKTVSDKNKDFDAVSLGLMEESEAPSFELTVEEGKRLAKEYSRMLMRDTRARQAEESIRLQLKNEAIAALPPRLREAALVPDLTPFPSNRFRATLTPPIEGYAQKMKDAAKKVMVKEKLR